MIKPLRNPKYTYAKGENEETRVKTFLNAVSAKYAKYSAGRNDCDIWGRCFGQNKFMTYVDFYVYKELFMNDSFQPLKQHIPCKRKIYKNKILTRLGF